MIERAYNFCCDWCGAARCYLFNNIKDAKHDARIEDWIIYHKDMCFCSKECFNDYIRDAHSDNICHCPIGIYDIAGTCSICKKQRSKRTF